MKITSKIFYILKDKDNNEGADINIGFYFKAAR